MAVDIKHEGSATVITISGEATVQTVENLAGALRKAVEGKSGDVSVDVTSLQKADITLFQVLVALKTTLDRKGRKLDVKGLGGELPLSRDAASIGLDLGFLMDEAEGRA